MRVLGIDPGLTRCGLGVVDGRAGRASMVAVGVVRTPADAEPSQRLIFLETELGAWMDRFAPEAVAVERVFADSNVTSVMTTAHATAIALLIYFWRDWVRIIKGLATSIAHREVRTSDQRLAWLLVLDAMIFQAEAEVRWLDHCETRLRQARPVPDTASAPAPAPAPGRVSR